MAVDQYRMMAFDCEAVRNAFRKSVVERGISGRNRHRYARLLALELTQLDEIDPHILNWLHSELDCNSLGME